METLWRNNNNFQCHRCEGFRHGANCCRINPKCVRCGFGHFSPKCQSALSAPRPTWSTTRDVEYFQSDADQLLSSRQPNLRWPTTNIAVSMTRDEYSRFHDYRRIYYSFQRPTRKRFIKRWHCSGCPADLTDLKHLGNTEGLKQKGWNKLTITKERPF